MEVQNTFQRDDSKDSQLESYKSQDYGLDLEWDLGFPDRRTNGRTVVYTSDERSDGCLHLPRAIRRLFTSDEP
jgi:hypothetical protein